MRNTVSMYHLAHPMKKEASSLIVPALGVAGLGALVGGLRGASLTEAQRRTLARHYGYNEKDTSPGLRNAGRGALGGLMGGGLGTLAGTVAGIGLAGAGVGSGNVPLILAGGAAAPVSGLLGTLYGMKKTTDKYSSGNAREIMRHRRG